MLARGPLREIHYFIFIIKKLPISPSMVFDMLCLNNFSTLKYCYQLACGRPSEASYVEGIEKWPNRQAAY